MKITNKIIIGLVLLMLVACSVDTEPRNQMVARPIGRITDADRLFVGAMRVYKAAFATNRVLAMEVQTDMFNATADFGNRGGASHQMGATFSSQDYDISYHWRDYYQMIYNVNSAIASMSGYVPKDDKEEVLFDYYFGALHYLRASGYHNLVRFYAVAYNPSTASTELGVPVLLEADVNAKPSRSTIADVYAQIEKDIAIAEERLTGNTKGAAKANATLPTIDAVKALNARVKLDTHKFSEAATIAKELIASTVYALNSSESDMYDEWHSAAGAQESIFNIYTSADERSDALSSFISRIQASPVYFTPDFVPTKRMLDMYSAGDIRGKAWLQEQTVKYSTYEGKLILFWKLRGVPTWDSGPTAWRYTFVPKVYRISEMYLIAAEALAMAGQTGEATTILNKFQTSRSANLTPGSLHNIQEEWKKEFVGEGLISTAMKRWNIGFTNRPPQVLAAIAESSATSENGFQYIDAQPNSTRYLKFTWAIPANDMQNNPGLKGQQNPGW